MAQLSCTEDIKTKTIIKTMGNSESFDFSKLEHAVHRAVTDSTLREILIELVLKKVGDKVATSTRYINDIIESYLVQNNHIQELQEYITNRLEKNKEYSDKVNLLGTRLVTSPDYDRGELADFSVNQIQIAANRYLQRDMETGDITESMTGWFDRVAKHVVLGSIAYDSEIYDREGKQDKKSYNIGEPGYSPIFLHLSETQVDILETIHFKLNEGGFMKLEFREFLNKIINLLGTEKYQKLYQTYFKYMYEGIFEPNTPTLMNAGTKLGGLSACFTLSVDDNMTSIMRVDTDSAQIFKRAGGLGVNISHIRPNGSNIDGTFGAATGPISLVLELINKITDVVKSGGKRRGANMGLMEYWHPDINTFVDYKIQTIPDAIQTVIGIIKNSGFEDEKAMELINAITPEGNLLNFNISVMFDSDFWKFYNEGANYPLKFGDKVYGFNNSVDFINKIASSAWKSAEPGVVFKDNANKANPLLGLKGEIDICNPCAEQFMYDGESCTLGSINLSKLVRADNTFDWERYVQIIHDTTRFLNDVLEINQYPTEHIAEESNKSRRIGLGIMGLADMFFKIGVPYNSQEGFWIMEELSKTLYVESVKTSIDLAEERGACYWYDKFIDSGNPAAIDVVTRNYNNQNDMYIALGTEYSEKLLYHGIRNMWTTTVAPTGTISMIADCSSALEPIFSLVFSKLTTAGKYYYTSDVFKQALIKEGIYSQALLDKVEKNYGSCQGIDEIPQHIQKVFLTAMDLHWIDHVVAQSVWQNWIDNSISKTINMPYNVTVDDVRNAYILAHELGLKGIALFRDGSRNEQVLHVGSNVQSNKNEQTVQKDTPGTKVVQAPTRNQVERKIPPSRFGMNYIRDRIPENLMTDLTLHAGKSSTYMEKGDECPSCKELTLILEGGCSSCKKCGYASCSVA